MAMTESASDNGGCGLTALLAIGALAVGLLFPAARAYADDAPPYGSYALCVRLMVDNGFAPELCEPIEPRAEDTSDWSCRNDGNGICGETDRWTWGIGAFA